MFITIAVIVIVVTFHTAPICHCLMNLIIPPMPDCLTKDVGYKDLQREIAVVDGSLS